MRRFIAFAPPSLFVILMMFPASAARADGNANFVIGQRTLDEDFWDPVDTQRVYGVTVDVGKPRWPVNVALGYYESKDNGDKAFPGLGSVDFEGRVREFSVGALKTWKLRKVVHPYVGGGAAYVEARGEVDASIFGSDSDKDRTYGLYGEGGIYWRLGKAFNLGIHARLMRFTDVTLFGSDGDADYEEFGALLGWGWPARR